MEDSLNKAEGIISRRVGDEIVVIKDDGLSVHLLNKTAAIIWEKYSDTSEPDTIASALCERFEITLDEARRDVEDTIKQLEEIGLLKKCQRSIN